MDILKYPQPKYDDANTIYKDLITKLTTASNALNASNGSYGSADLVFGGDASKWKKFANTLRLRMAINLDDIDHAYASAQALAAVADGVITSNTDMLILLMLRHNQILTHCMLT